MRQKVRRIVVDGQRYLWRFAFAYRGEPTGALFARSTCVAFLEGHKTAPGRITFVTPADAQFGAPLNSGYEIVLDSGASIQLNLNQPENAASVIRLLRRLGWQPETRGAFEIEDGTEHLPELCR